MTYPATDKIDTITTCRLSPAVLKHREYRRELCLNSLNRGNTNTRHGAATSYTLHSTPLMMIMIIIITPLAHISG